MSDGYRNGAFALGVVTGGGIVLNLFLWSAYRANKARETIPHQEDAQGHPWVGFWDWLIATFVNPYDTIAQWSMALLSLAAVYLLWETLKASRQTLKVTQDMARENTRMGEAHVRAYLSFASLELLYRYNGGAVKGIRFRPKLRNTGQSPAKIRFLASDVQMFKGSPNVMTIPAGSFWPSQIRTGAGREIILGGEEILWDRVVRAQRDGEAIIVAAYVEFADVFDGPPISETFCVQAQVMGRLSDASLPVEEQPTCEWHDVTTRAVVEGQPHQ